MQLPDGTLRERTCGVPQGGVISPVLSNLFLHYVYDTWMKRNHPLTPWCRYADDGLAHCETKAQAESLLVSVCERFAECGLELHPEKTKIVYCKDDNRKEKYPMKQFDFLGYTFCGRLVKKKAEDVFFVSFSPAVSKRALKSMRAKTRQSNLRNRTDKGLDEIAEWYNPVLHGWINYYGRYN